jgi:hypothetical protein
MDGDAGLIESAAEPDQKRLAEKRDRHPDPPPSAWPAPLETRGDDAGEERRRGMDQRGVGRGRVLHPGENKIGNNT